MVNKPVWGKRVEHALIDKGMTKRELARRLRINYTQLVCVIAGSVINNNIKSSVCTYLGVEE